MKILFQKGHPQLNTGRTHFKKGIIPWNKGEKGLFKHTEEWKKRMSERRKGRKLSEGTKEKLRKNHNSKSNFNLTNRYQFLKGITPWNKGKKMSYPNMGRKKGCIPWNKDKICLQMTREKHPNWKGGVSKGYKEGYWSMGYKRWRKSVFTRDNFTCQIYRKVGIYLTAHHIKSWAKYPKLRFDINNGVTLCESCHSLTDNYKGRERKIL